MSKELIQYTISSEDLDVLKKDKATMNKIGWAMRNVNKIGSTLETGATFIPEKVMNILQKKDAFYFTRYCKSKPFNNKEKHLVNVIINF